MPLIPPEEGSLLDALVKRVRRAVKDYPDETISTVEMNASTGVLKPPEEDLTKFKTSGIRIEWDDETGEMGVTTGPANDVGEVPVRRGRFGTAAADHEANVTVLVDPRFPFLRVADAVGDVIDGDLLPHVWVPGEQTFPWQATNEFYDPGVADIIEINYVFQIHAGGYYKVGGTRYTPADAIDDEAYPNGLLTIPRGNLIGTADILASFKARPTVFNLLPRQQGLVALGARASLMLDEEIEHVAPGRSAIRDRVQEGSKSNAGRTLRAQFLDRRDSERNLLLKQLAEQGTRFLAHH